jgi:hypothetical protein
MSTNISNYSAPTGIKLLYQYSGTDLNVSRSGASGTTTADKEITIESADLVLSKEIVIEICSNIAYSDDSTNNPTINLYAKSKTTGIYALQESKRFNRYASITVEATYHTIFKHIYTLTDTDKLEGVTFKIETSATNGSSEVCAISVDDVYITNLQP